MLACHFDLTLQLGMCTDGGVADPRELGHSGWSAFLVCFLAGAIAHRGHSMVSRALPAEASSLGAGQALILVD